MNKTSINKNNVFFSSSEPNLSRFGDSLMKKMASGRHSLRFSSKKKSLKLEALVPVFEGSAEEKTDEREEEEEEEVEEEYVLPAIPDVPLSGKNRPHVPSVSVWRLRPVTYLQTSQQLPAGKLGPSQQHWDLPSSTGTSPRPVVSL